MPRSFYYSDIRSFLRESVEGYPEDHTRQPEFYDATYKYLKSLGIK